MSQNTPAASETLRLFASPPPVISSSSEPPALIQPTADSSSASDATANSTSASLGLNQQVTFARRRISEDSSDMKFQFSCVFDAKLLDRPRLFHHPFRGIPFAIEFHKPTPSSTIECRVYCNKGNSSRLWKCTAAICRTMVLPASIPVPDEYTEYEFSSEQPCHELSMAGNWTCLMDFTFKIVVRSVVGISLKHVIDFTKPKANVFDGILLVEGRKVYVGKSFLAMYSPYFNALFFSGFHESSLEEIQITGDDIKYKDFIEFLSYIYPNDKRIKRSRVETLLKFADRFDVPSLRERCERWLIEEPMMDKAHRLLIAEHYQLSGLQNHILRQLKTQQDIQRLSKSPSYAELADASKSTIFQRMLEIMDSKQSEDGSAHREGGDSSVDEISDISYDSRTTEESGEAFGAPMLNVNRLRRNLFEDDIEDYHNRMRRRHGERVIESEDEEDESMDDDQDDSEDIIVVD
ncbi:unnamed protein product [Caenorhabditis brenneri]